MARVISRAALARGSHEYFVLAIWLFEYGFGESQYHNHELVCNKISRILSDSIANL